MTAKMMILSLVIFVLASSVAGFRFITPRLLHRSVVSMSDVESVAAPKFHQVFIGNIPQDMSEDAITNLVRERAGGSFASLRLAKEKTGQFRGFGYIDYVEKEQAEAAIAALTGVDMDGRVLKVDLAVPREIRPKPERPPQENSCFVGNLDFGVSDEQILDLCNSVLGEGKVVKVRLAVDRETGRKRGFGHIDFVSPEDAKRAIEMLNGAEVGGRGLRIDHARRKEEGAATGAAAPRTPRSADGAPRSYPERSSDNSVFLGNLAWDVTEELLKEMLDDIIGAGSYTNVRLATDRETGRLKGYAHVDFVDTPTATRAVQELNNLSVLERPLRADLAQRKTLSSGGGSGSGAGYGGGKSGGSGGFRSNGSANGNGYGAKRDFGGY